MAPDAFPFIPYGRQSVDDNDVDAVTRVLRGEWLTTGPAVTRFEADLAEWTAGTPTVAVTSGTAALHVAYAAAGVGPGDEVVVPPMTFVATAAAASLLGATVVFADVRPDTGTLDVAAAEAVVTDRTKVVVAVDYAGHPAQLDALQALAHRHGALLVEDAAHSLGSSWRGRPVGSVADLTTFSFFPTKNLTTAEGGAVATPHDRLLERARSFRNHGLVRDPVRLRRPDEGPWHQEVHTFGLNYRLPDVLCALGSSQLRRVAAFKQRRAEIMDRYRAGLADVPGIGLTAVLPGADPMWHLCAVQVLHGRRRALYDALRAQGIGVQVNYLPVHWHPVYAELGWRRGQLPVAEEFYRRQLSLPLYVDLTDAQVDRVIEAVRSFFGA